MDKLGLLFWCLSNSVFLVVQADIPVNNTEPALLNYLFQNYSKDARPVLNVDDPVQLKLGIMLRQVIDLDEREQILTTNVWIRQYWADHFLQWNPDDFSGIKSIIIAPDKVWKPDVLLFNQVNTDFGNLNNKIDTNVIVSHDGNISWLAPAILKSGCNIDVRYFPFDVQYCNLAFGPWSNNILKIDIQLKNESGVDTESFTENKEWFLKGAPGRRDVTT
ncbi:neuronal acetylcholine receptor subunit beta-3-like [Nematostella vectensis]|uniref:neuronal acetylcholine receptor subunit beta-3-like n=1 Tax=Nematostella vectensis TaxID=45351 RepID=UPI00207713A9|nr:neuronal acetylcholine receptor subunit beta-3-like [Nematostella vectensis]